jgi:ABC-type uncharacterized transport system auxiliary subunit
LALAGCALFRSTPQVRSYTLALAGEPPARLAAPVRIGVLTIDQPYATERLAYRTSPYRLDYYTYHRWAADPRQLVQAAARDYLERATASGTGAETASTPFEIMGHIRRIEEIDTPAGWQGALALDLRVERGGTLVLACSYAETEPAEARNPEAVAAALSRALARILDGIVAELAAPGATQPSALR